MSFTFAPLTTATAPDTIRPVLVASERRFGFLPSPVAKAAHAPVALKHLLAGFAAFDQTSLTSLEREVIAMTVAFEHGCHYCMAMHSALQAGEPAAEPIVTALRAGTTLPDAKLEALHQLARALVRGRGHVSEANWRVFASAGYTEPQALEVVLGVSVYVLSTFMNIVSDAELDPPFAPFAWEPPVTASPS